MGQEPTTRQMVRYIRHMQRLVGEGPKSGRGL